MSIPALCQIPGLRFRNECHYKLGEPSTMIVTYASEFSKPKEINETFENSDILTIFNNWPSESNDLFQFPNVFSKSDEKSFEFQSFQWHLKKSNETI